MGHIDIYPSTYLTIYPKYLLRVHHQEQLKGYSTKYLGQLINQQVNLKRYPTLFSVIFNLSLNINLFEHLLKWINLQQNILFLLLSFYKKQEDRSGD